MNLAKAAQNNVSQDEVMVSSQSNGQVAVYFGTNMQSALNLKNTIYVGVSNRTVSFSTSESEVTPSQLSLHKSSNSSKRLRAYTKKGTPTLPNVTRTVTSIQVNDGVASFKY